MKSRINKYSWLALAAAFLIFSCTTKSPQVSKEDSGQVKTRDSVLLDAQKKRDNWTSQLKAMNIQQLSVQLNKESEDGLESFNSMAFKELVSRGRNSVTELIKEIKVNNRTSLLNVLAVREMDKEKFQSLSDSVKSGVLIDALKNAKTFNSFGLPNVKWEAAAQAIIESGNAVRRGLISLLSDKRPAPMWGSDDRNVSLVYQFRVCDYAYALLTSQKGEAVQLPQKPEERDRLIEEFIQKNK